jgi:hypothetical protein
MLSIVRNMTIHIRANDDGMERLFRHFELVWFRIPCSRYTVKFVQCPVVG